jgi:DNA helicase-2/ATP-dependent DNA helicase PcrA
VPGGAAFLERAEVRDVLAWMRLLVDPHDAAAVVRVLARPPIELGQAALARVIQLARRRKLDLVSGLAAAGDSPQLPPQARERIQRFLELHRGAAAALESARPDLFVRAVLGADAEQVPEERGRPAETLRATLQVLREEVLAGVGRIAGRLRESRLDTDLDISHGVVRYLELLKLAALVQRPAGQDVEETISDLNARLLAAATPLQREIFQTSTLDQTLVSTLAERTDDSSAHSPSKTTAPSGEPDGGSMSARAAPGSPRSQAIDRFKIIHREESSLGPFLPRKGVGVALSASDIATYLACPLRYKFARVLRIPTEQTLQQRFGITVHQVLERYHAEGGRTLAQMLDLLDAGWRRAGFRESARERRLREKARMALTRYHARLDGEEAEPVWFERQFAFWIGPHHLRGRVDRVDRLAAGAREEYELIDYKTSRPKTPTQLKDDVQLSLYALAARDAWQLGPSRQAYHYVLDDRKVPVPRGERDAESVRGTVLEVGERILAEEFDPTPSPAVCSVCDYRIVCPAAEN